MHKIKTHEDESEATLPGAKSDESYPRFRIDDPVVVGALAAHGIGEEFDLTVRVKVKSLTVGRDYNGAPPADICLMVVGVDLGGEAEDDDDDDDESGSASRKGYQSKLTISDLLKL